MSKRRDPTGNQLLTRMHFKHGAYWYVLRNKWTKLATGYNQALREYAALQNADGSMPMLIGKTFDEFEYRVKVGTLSDQSLRTYRSKRAVIATAFQHFNPEDVTPSIIRQFIRGKYGTKPNAGNQALSILRQAFELGIELGLCEMNPAKQVTRKTEAKRTRYINDAEFAAIRQVARAELPLIMDVLYYTGQRIGDVLAIKQADIVGGKIQVEQIKTGHRVNIEIGPALSTAIRAARRGTVTGLYLFSRGGKPIAYTTVRSQWLIACERARVADAHLHDIRAKAATDYKKAGGDSQAFSGHEDERTHAIYLRDNDVPNVPSLDKIWSHS
jgi:integrase